MEQINKIPDYDQDDTFDENIDYEGCRTMVIVIFTAFGCFIAALGLGIYYYIINNF
jgi:hypothetical protein